MDVGEILNPPVFFCLVAALALIIYAYSMLKANGKKRNVVEHNFPSRIQSGELVPVIVKGQIYIPRETIEQIALVKQYIPSSAKPVESEKPSEQTAKHKPLIRRVEG